MDTSGFQELKWKDFLHLPAGGLIGAGLGYLGWNGRLVSPLGFALWSVLILAYYVNNRRIRRSVNINSMAMVTIEAEPTVSWQLLDSQQELLEEGSGQAQFLVPVSIFSTGDVSTIFRFLPEKWLPKLEQSRFCTYKPRMTYSYIVRTLIESDVLVGELQLKDAYTREESLDGEVCLFLFILDPVHMSRHWIWPDWFEIFNRQVEQE
jgi:hypothetical protein